MNDRSQPSRRRPSRLAVLLLAGAMVPAPQLVAQRGDAPTPGTDSVTVEASNFYHAVGGFHRWLLGDSYRDLWAVRIRVPVLDLGAIGGGLKPEKMGGGNSTRSLHLDAADGSEYVFRSVDKDPRNLPGSLDDSKLAKYVSRDQVSAKHPAANLIFEPFYDAVNVIHDDGPRLYVMPDDPVLGEYREEMAGVLGVLSLFPSKGEESAAKFGVVDILDTDSLVPRLNSALGERVDPAPYLRARLLDMLLNNWDRHTGNWKWARRTASSDWEPIARDMDNALANHEGFLPGLARHAAAKVITFDSTYPAMAGLMYNARDLDRRILLGTSRATFDSTARWLQRQVTDDLIATAMARMPAGYEASAREIGAKLRMRRDSLPVIAGRFYEALNAFVTLHGTDADERVTVTRAGPGIVDVRIEGPDGAPTLTRRFEARETSEIRIYLHDGNDAAIVRGDVASSIPVSIIGGNGSNTLVDSSRVAGTAHVARLYDVGRTEGVEYVADTLLDRRPVVAIASEPLHPGRDYGRSSGPILDIGTSRDMGFMPTLGYAWRSYGLRRHPYASELALTAAYSFRNEGWKFGLAFDRRGEASPWHVGAMARMSQLEVLNYHGLGNETPNSPGVPVGERAPRDGFYGVQQDQWSFQPTIGYALGVNGDLRLGPVVQYTVSEGPPNGFLELTDPYGAGSFGQAGLRGTVEYDTRDRSSNPRRGILLESRADWFPAIWDARGSFGSVGLLAGGYVTLPLPLEPYLGLRVIGRKVFGDFPFHEAAFLGGRGGIRVFDPQRYAGDAVLAAKLNLRVPITTLHVYLPWEIGVFAEQEVGRVYVEGESPGGWHNAFSAGFWAAFDAISINVRLIEENERSFGSGSSLQAGFSMGMP